MQHPGDEITNRQFPGHLTVGGNRFPLEYHFNPGDEQDGMSVTIPLPLLHQVEMYHFDRLAPGLLEKKIVALLKSLPKSLRRPLVPLPNSAQRVIEDLDQCDPKGQLPLTTVLEEILHKRFQLRVPLGSWRLEELPDHLRMNYKVVDEKNQRILAQGRDLDHIKREIGQEAQSRFQALPKEQYEQRRLTRWTFGELPEFKTFQAHHRTIHGYPALVEEEDGSVSLKLMDSMESAEKVGRMGLRRLFLLQLSKQDRQLRRQLPLSSEACMAYRPWGGETALKREIIATAAEAVFLPDGPMEIRDAETFQNRLQQGRGHFMREAQQHAKLAGTIMVHYSKLLSVLNKPASPTLKGAIPDIRQQLDHLVYEGFLCRTPVEQLAHYPRYLQGITLRLERRRYAPGKDDAKQKQVAPFWQALLGFQKRYAAKERPPSPELIAFRWMVEEFRISTFAQDLRCPEPISVKRLQTQKGLIAPP